jgi:hypothetical protein
MNLNVALPLASSILSFIFAAFLVDQWRARRRPYQLIWAIGLLWYALSAGTEFLGGAFGWSEPLDRAWYLILIAIGGLLPAITSGANRFGVTSGFFVGELLGVLFLFGGFLVSIEVFSDIRVPFTRHVVRHRMEA